MPMIRFLYWTLAGLIGAGAVHLSIVLLVPGMAERDLTSRLVAAAPLNTITALDDAVLARSVNFADRTALYAACPYDLGVGPLALVAPAGETPLSFVFLGQGGSIFAALTDRAASQGLLQLRLLTALQSEDLIDSEGGANASAELRLIAPDPRGAVLIKALVSSPSRKAAAAAAIAEIRCGAL
jgi:uncharacterized membrane protein